MHSNPTAQFTALYEREHDAVLRFVLRRLPAADLTRAEDLTQDAFLAAWRSLETLPTTEPELRAWLFSAVRKRLLQESRRLSRQTALTVRVADDADLIAACHSDDVAELLDLTNGWRELDPQDQEALSLATFEGLTSAQAAQVLGISATAYRVRLLRARRALERAGETQILAAQAEANPANVQRRLIKKPAT